MAIQDEYKQLRALFNPSIRGNNTDAILSAIASGTAYLTSSVQQVYPNIYISSAVGQYLDQRLADYGLSRPSNVGLPDDIYSQIGIQVVNRKQVRDLINQLFLAMFGSETTNATSSSSELETYNLVDGDTLQIQFDGAAVQTIIFQSSQFSSIAAAKAQEVADAITQSLRNQGANGSAFVKNDGLGNYVVLLSNTIGPSSSVTVVGGSAQNKLRFPSIRPTTADATTQWTITQAAGGYLRFTWSGGTNPGLAAVQAGDYANIYSSAFSANNRGSFPVVNVQGGLVDVSYFEISNPDGTVQTTAQGTTTGILFFEPEKQTILSKYRYAALFQTEKSLLEIFIPATTKVVRRSRKGSAHLHDPILYSTTSTPGSNLIFDVTFPAPGSIVDGHYITFSNTTNNYFLYFDTTGSNLNIPTVTGAIGIRVITSGLTSALEVATAAAYAVSSVSGFNCVSPTTPTSRIVVTSLGTTVMPVNVNVSGLTLSVYQTGSAPTSVTTATPNPVESFPGLEGPYVYDPTQNFVISSTNTLSSEGYDPDTGRVISVNDSSAFPDAPGYIVIGYGTSHQEGPIPYLARPSNGTLLINPSYRIQKVHPAGTSVCLVAQIGPVQIAKDGSDYPFYITDVVSGRTYAEQLINLVAATGINVLITIIYPGDVGLGKAGTPYSEKTEIWGP